MLIVAHDPNVVLRACTGAVTNQDMRTAANDEPAYVVDEYQRFRQVVEEVAA